VRLAQAFLDGVDDYLQPFVSRREQARALRDAIDPSKVRVTVDATFTTLHAEFPGQPHQEVFVLYDDARSSQPTRVRVFHQVAVAAIAEHVAAAGRHGRGAGGSRRFAVVRWPEAEGAFHRLRLADAFLEVFPECRAVPSAPAERL